MKENSIYTLIYSQFLRELTLVAFWADVLCLILVAVTSILSVIFLENPIKNIMQLLAVRAFITGDISIWELESYGMLVLSNIKMD